MRRLFEDAGSGCIEMAPGRCLRRDFVRAIGTKAAQV
jgi:hypothetical protein